MALTQVQGGMLAGSSNTTTTIQSNGTTAITIDASQNVGIGTSSPLGKLHINQTGGVAAISQTYAVANFQNSFSGGGDAMITLTGSNQGIIAALNASQGAVPMTFYTGQTERMRIASTGELLVNTTTPQNSPLIQANGDTSTYNMFVLKDTGTTYSSGNRYCLFLNSSAALAGSIYHSAATTVNFNTTSDARLKTDKGVATDTSVIDNTIIHDFEWKADNRLDRGVFAQEAYEVKPSAVGVGTDELTEDNSLANPWGVDYSKYVPDLIVYCQQLKKSIQELNAKVTALETQLAAK